MPGATLHRETYGSGPRLVLVHGFTQSGRGWGEIGRALSRTHTVVAVDAPGHGRSAGVEADLGEGAALLAATAEAAGGGASWLGYSMGGRYALHVALAYPSLVERLVLVSTTAGIDDPAERRARREWDEGLARRVEGEGVEAFLRWWLSQPLFASLPPGAAGLESRLGGTAAGLASSLRRAGTGNQEPLWTRLEQIGIPVLVVAGQLDTKYVQLAERLVSSIGPNASLAVIGGAGHACHLERPGPFVDAVLAWLDGPAGSDPQPDC